MTSSVTSQNDAMYSAAESRPRASLKRRLTIGRYGSNDGNSGSRKPLRAECFEGSGQRVLDASINLANFVGDLLSTRTKEQPCVFSFSMTCTALGKDASSMSLHGLLGPDGGAVQ